MQKPINDFAKYGLSTPEFSLKGIETFCRVVSVYDADTITVVMPLFDSYYRFNIRLLGIDCPEMKSKILENKKKAIRARNQVIQWLLPNKTINLDETYTKKQIQEMFAQDVAIAWIKCDEYEKFGRILANLYSNFNDPEHLSFSNRLIAEGLAYSYMGGTKLTEEEQLNM